MRLMQVLLTGTTTRQRVSQDGKMEYGACGGWMCAADSARPGCLFVRLCRCAGCLVVSRLSSTLGARHKIPERPAARPRLIHTLNTVPSCHSSVDMQRRWWDGTRQKRSLVGMSGLQPRLWHGPPRPLRHGLSVERTSRGCARSIMNREQITGRHETRMTWAVEMNNRRTSSEHVDVSPMHNTTHRRHHHHHHDHRRRFQYVS